MNPLEILDAIRHGETTAGHCYLGRTDAPLTQYGNDQMRDAVQCVDSADYQVVISSPLSRCSLFAQEWASAAPLLIEPEMVEFDFGDWDGLTAKEIMTRWPGQLEQFWEDPLSMSPPNGESLSAFLSRIENVLTAIKGSGHSNVMLITHGGVIKAMHCLINGLSPRSMFQIPVEHGSLHRLVGNPLVFDQDGLG